MLKVIKQCFEKKQIASFYCNAEDVNLHLTGYVGAFNDNEILINHISPNGNYDGYILKHIEDIYKIDVGGKYEKKIEDLYRYKEQSHIIMRLSDNSVLHELIKLAKEKNYIFSVEIQDNVISGIVNEYNEDIIRIEIVDDYGFKGGTEYVHINQADTFAVDTIEEQDIKILYQIKIFRTRVD